jgi:capsular polysaccharide biosynthesis protein
MINLTPLTQRVLRLTTGRKTYQQLCDKQWTLYPCESLVSPPAIYLDGELDKVTAVQPETTYAHEIRRLQGGKLEHGATTAYQLRNTHILNGYVYKGPMKHTLVMTKESLFNSSVTDYIPKAALASTFSGIRYFGHWMTDDLTLALAAQQLAKPVAVARELTEHQVEYRDLFEIHTIPVTQVKCGELIIIDDVGQNRFKRERYEYMRSQLKKFGLVQSHRGVMFLRGTSGVQRFLINEDEVAEFLKDRGFAIINPSRMSATEIVRQTLGAKVIVGVEGSQLTHGLFSMADDGTILTLQPPYRFNNVYKDYTDCLGMKYAFVIGKEVSDGFEINLDDLARTLDKIENYQL